MNVSMHRPYLGGAFFIEEISKRVYEPVQYMVLLQFFQKVLHSFFRRFKRLAAKKNEEIKGLLGKAYGRCLLLRIELKCS